MADTSASNIKKENTLSHFELYAILTRGMLGAVLFGVYRAVVERAGRDSWISFILAGLLVQLASLIIIALRGTFILGVTQGKAEDIIIGVNLRNQPFVGIYLKELLRGANREGIAHALTLMEFYRYMNIDGIDPCMPYLMIAPTKDHILVNHTAVFRGDRFVGILEQDESIAVMILKNLVKEGRMAMDLSSSEEGGLHDSIAVDLYRTSRKITPMIDGERVKIKIEVKVTGQLLEHTLSERSLSYSSIKRQESLFGEKLKNDMKKALSKLQEYQADIVGFGEIVRVKYPEFFDKEKWREDFAGAEFDIDVDFWIKRIGTAS